MDNTISFEITKWNDLKIIWIDSDNIDACMDLYYKENIDIIAISPSKKYNLYNIDFLINHTDIKGIFISYANKIDISKIKLLHNLRIIYIADNTQAIDYNNFKNLEVLCLEWCKNNILPKSDRLKKLILRKYKPESKSLIEIGLLNLLNLESLEIVQGIITSLDGIVNFPKIKVLDLAYLTKINNLSCLESNTLEILKFHVCRQIHDFDMVSNLKNLKKLYIHDCGKIKSIQFIKKLKNLQFISIVNSSVEDGDMSCCLDVPKFFFDDKKHYSHKFKDLRELWLKKQSK